MTDLSETETEIDSKPPADLLVLLALEDSDGWQSRADIQTTIECRVGVTPSERTLREALARLRESDLGGLEYRHTTTGGTSTYLYRRR